MYMMKLDAKFFDKMRARKKVYEVRLNDEKRKEITIGDKIIFKRRPELIDGMVVRVVEIKRYSSFEQVATSMSLESLGFENENIQSVVDFYHTIYTPEDEKKYGVVVFKVELM